VSAPRPLDPSATRRQTQRAALIDRLRLRSPESRDVDDAECAARLTAFLGSPVWQTDVGPLLEALGAQALTSALSATEPVPDRVLPDGTRVVGYLPDGLLALARQAECLGALKGFQDFAALLGSKLDLGDAARRRIQARVLERIGLTRPDGDENS